jgi:exopolyphosphatase/guanosine-5'-triphosphate,3'-diphosphate pyrophosphatase
MSEGTRRVAVIDIGSNSTRLLVADVLDGRVTPIERRSTVTRLGRGVDLSGRLAAEAIEAACAAVDPYVATLQELGAEAVDAVATSAVRDAENGSAFIAELRERFALSARVLGGDEEARLTYLGATSEHSPEVPTLVLDIGGGSTEMIVGERGEVEFHVSTQVGVVRHTERHLHSDPPTAEELAALAADARTALEAAVPEAIRARAGSAVAVAGTATSVAAIDLELDPYDPARVEGHRVTRERLEEVRDRLAALPLEERRHVTGLDPNRAPTIVAGTVILLEVLGAFALDAFEASERDILWGVALDSK